MVDSHIGGYLRGKFLSRSGIVFKNRPKIIFDEAGHIHLINYGHIKLKDQFIFLFL